MPTTTLEASLLALSKKGTVHKGKYSALVNSEKYDDFNAYAWQYHPEGYANRTIYPNKRKTTELMHVHVWKSYYGEPPTYTDLKGKVRIKQIDHINGNRLDNRIENLRVVTTIEQRRNHKKMANSLSKYFGVYKRTRDKVFTVQIVEDGKQLFYKSFKNEIDAAKMYDNVVNNLNLFCRKLNKEHFSECN